MSGPEGGQRGGMREGVTHCSSSRQRRPHSPQTGCSGWSSQRRCHPGSGTRPRRRPSLEQPPPRDHQARVFPAETRRPQPELLAQSTGPATPPTPPLYPRTRQSAAADALGPGEAGRGGGGQALCGTHCCRGSRLSHLHSHLPHCTTACWTRSARCCTGGRSSCSGGSLGRGTGHRSAAALGRQPPEALITCPARLWAWPRVGHGSALHDHPRLLSHSGSGRFCSPHLHAWSYWGLEILEGWGKGGGLGHWGWRRHLLQ